MASEVQSRQKLRDFACSSNSRSCGAAEAVIRRVMHDEIFLVVACVVVAGNEGSLGWLAGWLQTLGGAVLAPERSVSRKACCY